MRKYAVLSLVLFVLLSTLIQTAAQNTAFHQDDQVVIKSGIKFVWMRSGPTAECACVEYVISSSKRVMRILDAEPTSDGVENWWHVTTVTLPIKQGWIEEKTLTLWNPAPTAIITPNGTQQSHQFLTNAVQIRDGVPFIWIRSSPSSTAPILQTVKFSHPADQSQCLTLATIGPVIRWDGQQWWRALIPSTAARTDIQSGWVEENSLVDCDPTLSTPNSTATAAAGSPSATPSDVVTLIPPTSTNAAYELFERGLMIWRQDNQTIYVLINGAGFVSYTYDSYIGLTTPTDAAPAGRYTPINGFGKVWGGQSYFGSLIRDKIGWATASEQGYTAQVSSYIVASAAKPDSHIMISLPNGHTVNMGSAFGSWSYN